MQIPFVILLIISHQKFDLEMIYGILIYNLLLFFLFNNIHSILVNALQTKYHSQELIQEKANILTAVSHDLRQPLLAQDLFIEELNDIVEDKNILKLVQFLESTNRSLHNLVSSILEISQLDTCKIKPNIQHITLKLLIEEIEHEFIPRM